MLKFKDFLGEAVLDYYRGKKLITTKHLIKRKIERNASDDEIKHIFRKTADHLEQNDYGNQRKFLVYSKKYNRAVAFSHQKNTNDPKDKRKHLVATTVFPTGENYANKKTKLVNVEGYSAEFLDYIDTFVNEETKTAEPLSEVLIEGVEFYFLNGELDNIPFVEFFEVE